MSSGAYDSDLSLLYSLGVIDKAISIGIEFLKGVGDCGRFDDGPRPLLVATIDRYNEEPHDTDTGVLIIAFKNAIVIENTDDDDYDDEIEDVDLYEKCYTKDALMVFEYFRGFDDRQSVIASLMVVSYNALKSVDDIIFFPGIDDPYSCVKRSLELFVASGSYVNEVMFIDRSM